MKKHIITGILILISAGLIYSIFKPASLKHTLLQAGENRTELEQVLKHYRKDRKKYRAAKFLIENMRWHGQGVKVMFHDPQVDVFTREADSLYYTLIKGKPDEMLATKSFMDSLAAIDTPFRGRMEQYAFREPEVSCMDMPDLKNISAEFLIRHIDNAFLAWDSSPFARSLSFQDFCRYILPYRAIEDYPMVYSGSEYARVFGKYIHSYEAQHVSQAIERYNQSALRLRWFMGKYPFKQNIGFNELFFNGFHDCVDIAHQGAAALRACGIPAVVEYNVAYKLWSGKHFHVSTLDSLGRWCTFSPESELPLYRNPNFKEALNIYRIHFDKQPDNPFSLRNPDENIPENLSNPCIEDVTDNIMPVVKLNLPFQHKTSNRLAYLVSFQSQSGLVPATWGRINQRKQTVAFHRVVPDNLYFPMYYDSTGELTAFADPFWIKTDSLSKSGYAIEPVAPSTGKFIPVELTCKFPRKPGMLRLAENLRGVTVVASHTPDFYQPDTLYQITETPDEHWQEIDLKNSKPYPYYRVQNRAEYPHLHIAEIEFLTHKKYRYTNTMPPTPLPIRAAREVGKSKNSNLTRILDEPLEKCNWKAEYDGNVQTAPDAYRSITLKLPKAQVVSHIRFVPKSADNNIVAGDTYTLYKWNHSRWEAVKTETPHYHFIPVDSLAVGGLYWLRNLTQGKEELPFTINEKGEQVFLHYELLKILRQ